MPHPSSSAAAAVDWKRDVFRWCLVAAVTFVAGQADTLFLHSGLTYGTLVFAPGCLLPFFLWWGGRYWTAALFGAITTMMFLPGIRTVAAQYSWISIPAISIAFTVEIGLTVWLLRRWKFRDDLSRGRDALLLLCASFLGTFGYGCIAMPIVYWPEQLPLSAFLLSCITWWLMHFVSIVVLTPALLTWTRWPVSSSRETLFLAIIFITLTAIETAGFRLWNPVPMLTYPLFFVGLPLVLWGVLSYGLRAAAVIVVTTYLLAGYATACGVGPFDGSNAIWSNFQLNVFLLSFGVTFNLVGCFAEESRESVERLKIEHALLAKAEEIAGVGSWQYDALTHEQQWSGQFYRQLGLPPNGMTADINAFVERFIVPDERKRFMDQWNSFVSTGQPDRTEFRVRRNDDRERIFMGQGDVQRDSRGRPVRFVGTARDVTDQRQAMADRQRMQELLNKAEELANRGSWEMDGTGFMPVWSDNFYRLCGVERGDFDGTFDSFLQRFVHPEDREHLWKAFLNFADGTGPDWVEFRHVRSDGSIRDFHAHVQMARREHGQLVRCYGTTTDITERKEAERKLKEEEQRYRLLADHSSDMIARVCDDGILAYVSPACQKILGYEPEEILGRTLLDLVSPDDQLLCRQAMDRLLDGEEHAAVPFRGRRKNGSVVWLENNSKLLVDETGRRELLCVIRDITERRTLEEQIAQAQRLEAIGRLAGGIAHDFNNILTVINGYAEILEIRFSEDNQATKFVANILEAGRRASQLTRQLLTYSRKQLVSRGMIDLNAVIRTLQPLLMPLIGETIELSLRLDPAIGLIEGDAGQLEQLIMNLAVNSRDAMPAGGRLTLETSGVSFSPSDARPHRLPPGPCVKLVVADNGQGMDDNVKAHLFEPFFTTKAAGQGTGLGLATVYATMEQCGGALAVDSAPGAGCRFELYFPAHSSPASPEPVSLTFREFPESSNGHRRILVVEDDDPVRSLVELTLREASYSVKTAASGEDALKLIDADPGSFDLLLTDVVMKGVNGRELADMLRQRAPHLSVIFMSGHTEDAVVRSGVLNDQLTFLQKPFTADELMERVQHVLARQAV